MLGVEFPICAFSHCRDVVAAVTNAGGFGILGAVAHSPERLENELTWIEEQTGGKPYGVDLLLPPNTSAPSRVGSTRGRSGRCCPRSTGRSSTTCWPAMASRVPTDGPRRRARRAEYLAQGLRAAARCGLRARHSADRQCARPPPADLVQRAHDQDVLVAALAGTTQHARRHAAAGVDLIVAQGTEAGGHTGEVATMVLVPEVVDAVAPTPVLAAGGIARGRQIAAALALGAEGVWCGSVWLTTEEAETPPVVKDKFLAASSSDTVRSRSMTGKPARMLRTAWTDEWDRPDTSGPARDAAADRAGHRTAGAHQPGRRSPGRQGSRAGDLFRRPGGRLARPGPADACRWCSTWSRSSSTPLAGSRAWSTSDPAAFKTSYTALQATGQPHILVKRVERT